MGLITNLAKKVHAINHAIMAARIARPGKIDAAPVDLSCYLGSLVLYGGRGRLRHAVAIKTLP